MKIKYKAIIEYVVDYDPNDYVKPPTYKQAIKQERRDLKYDLTDSWLRSKLKIVQFDAEEL